MSRAAASCWRSRSRACSARPGTSPASRCAFGASADGAGTSRRARRIDWRRCSGCCALKATRIRCGPPRWRRRKRPPRAAARDKVGARTWGTPMANDLVSRFFGGPPLAVLARLILLCILVGVILHTLGFDPGNIIESIRRMVQAIWDMGFDAVRWVWRYFLLGAIIVIPIWLILRFARAPRA